MKTTTNTESMAICLKYSDDPQKLEQWLESAKIEFECYGSVKSPWSDDLQALKFVVSINGYSFDYHGSHVDALAWSGDVEKLNRRESVFDYHKRQAKAKRNRKHKRDEIENKLLYSVLACCRSDVYCGVPFLEFCDEFGYDSDSIKALNTWESCFAHANALMRVIPEDVYDALPA